MILSALDVDYWHQLPYGTTARARRKRLLIALAIPGLFLTGLATGWIAARQTTANRAPQIAELALLCTSPTSDAAPAPYRPIRLNAANLFCVGGIR